MKRLYYLLMLLVAFMLPACNQNAPSNGSTTTSEETNTGDDSSDFVENQTFTTTLSITWNGTSATVEGSADSVTITNSNGYVTIVSSAKKIAYAVSGSGTGQLSIYSDYKFKLEMNSLSLSCTDGPAINDQCHKTTYVVLSGTNTLSDGSSYASTDEDRKAAFFSEGQLIFSGDGSLNVTGNYKHAIASDDYIRFRSGTYNLTANESDGVHTNDGIIIDGGSITIQAAGDGMQADTASIYMTGGEISVTASDKGLLAYTNVDITDGTVYVKATEKAIKAKGSITISGGTITAISSSNEGIEAKSTMVISGGTIYAQASDDAINSGSHMTITGGTVMAYSTGNDGIDANGNFYLQGGTVYAIGSRSPEVGIDANSEEGYQVYIQSGNMIAINGIENGASISQTCYSASYSTNTWYALYNGSDVVLAFKTPNVSASSMVVTSANCSLYSGVTGTGTTILNGYGNTAASGGSSVTLSTYSGGNQGGNPGGNPGGGGPGGRP